MWIHDLLHMEQECCPLFHWCFVSSLFMALDAQQVISRLLGGRIFMTHCRSQGRHSLTLSLIRELSDTKCWCASLCCTCRNRLWPWSADAALLHVYTSSACRHSMSRQEELEARKFAGLWGQRACVQSPIIWQQKSQHFQVQWNVTAKLWQKWRGRVRNLYRHSWEGQDLEWAAIAIGRSSFVPLNESACKLTGRKTTSSTLIRWIVCSMCTAVRKRQYAKASKPISILRG
jgi:hypothetical protein